MCVRLPLTTAALAVAAATLVVAPPACAQAVPPARGLDTDRDGLPDDVEDRDRDGRHDPGETHPHRPDTDGDGLRDGDEDANRNGRRDHGETSPTRACSGPPADRPCETLEDRDARHRGPRAPEPMVADLVRGLGARRGELEANVLALATWRPSHPAVHWAPELEYAFADDWAVELELPFRNAHLEGVKLALQGTFGTAARGRFVHGVQVLGELGVATGQLTGTAYYLAAARLARPLSVAAMLGAQVQSGADRSGVAVALLAHPSVFVEPTPLIAFGVEANVVLDPCGPMSALVMPQFRWRFAGRLTLQAGIGAQLDAQGAAPAAAIRVSVER